jgi:DNA-binding GntR family transcriptional regulator
MRTRSAALARGKHVLDEMAREPELSAAPLRMQAYETIVERMVHRRLLRGQVVTQRELVELCCLSLAAIREAIPRLEADGLIVTHRQRGLQIASIDVQFVRNAYQLRLILEREAVTHAARHAPADLLERIEADHGGVLAQIANPLPEGLADEAQRIDWAMHEALIGLLGNELVAEVYRVNSIKVRMASQQRLRVTGRNIGRMMREHMRIIEALKARDARRAAAAMGAHIDHSMGIALGMEEEPALDSPAADPSRRET